MYCGKCGTSVPEGAAFCATCGNPIGGAAPQQPANPVPQPPVNPAPQQPVNNANYQVPNVDASQSAYAQAQGMGTPVVGQAPVAMPPAIDTGRSLVLLIVLSIVTCGIYEYYFIYKLAQDVNRMCAADGDKIGGLAAYILLSFVTCGIYSYYWEYKIANRLQKNAPLYGLCFKEGGSTILLWAILGLFLCGIGPFVAMYMILKNTNAMAMAYNSRIRY